MVRSRPSSEGSHDGSPGKDNRVPRSGVLGAAVILLVALLLLLVGAADAAPTNDSFVAAQLLSGITGTVVGSTVGATRETGEPVPDPNASGNTIWFTWTATFSGSASFDTRGSDFDTYIAVYTGTRIDRLTFVAETTSTSSSGARGRSSARWRERRTACRWTACTAPRVPSA